MKHYIGIDLGTTNSAICSYDGTSVRIWKSPEQNDVTPSAIYVDRRGNRYYGRRAYEQSVVQEARSATLFKRYMGTNQVFLQGSEDEMSPVQCSAEILKVLFGYLPEEIRSDPDTATVITVPAAFDQMKKDATLEAARLAGIGSVALMQEPVAAIMSVMRTGKHEGIFLVYDLGGGTFDVSIAENIGGKVNLLAQGGREMCGGRDWDRTIFNHIVYPWLTSHFALPDDFLTNKQYRILRRIGTFAAERAKIELSSNTEAIIRADEGEIHTTDLDGEDIYIDIPISRQDLEGLIADLIDDTIDTTREIISEAGLTANDIEMIVFVGGPTNYKPLRDKVAAQLALPANTDVNPMTAVAEGASIFAESIDWSSSRRNRKADNAEVNTELDLQLRYDARTPDSKARVVFITKESQALSVEIVSTDSGWTSGRASIKSGLVLELPLSRDGENTFTVTVYDANGQPIRIDQNKLVITKTLATVGAIPASHSIGVEVLEKLGGMPVLQYLVKKNDPLPKKGQIVFKAGESLKAGSYKSLQFNLWEGDIQDPISDNMYIGTYDIPGTSFSEGTIPSGADLVCDYEMSDSGAIHLCLSVPSIGADFGDRSFYSRSQIDLSDTDKLAEDAEDLLKRIDAILERVDDERLEEAKKQAERTSGIGDREFDPEESNAAYNALQDAKKTTAQVKRDHLKEIRQLDLDECVDDFDNHVRKYAKPIEAEAFDNLARTAQRSIDRNSPEFDNQLKELRGRKFDIYWRQDWFIVNCFHWRVEHPSIFTDAALFEQLKARGQACVAKDDIEELRRIVIAMDNIRRKDVSAEKMFSDVNVIKG